MSTLNRLAGALVLLVVIGGLGGMGGLVADQQLTACSQSVQACQ